ncbi:hypothetical protein B0T26DRAFT_175740 [Lasiosphaeria miniovina]|uniref:Ubiquitin-like protease family profile domain-containing protein n=1 Tax=Lasiosphaeria miniovina TaxID=1954250 RepID=A0AA40B6C1_9PEZI|nr:uncharacterized protein B0T26DRAFT_175740 [Lasiosphaeria miniovina]KAK0728534.1 hypothetical protein B0T26DRAFT_175740 [Lasiosphaeria miniovina]
MVETTILRSRHSKTSESKGLNGDTVDTNPKTKDWGGESGDKASMVKKTQEAAETLTGLHGSLSKQSGAVKTADVVRREDHLRLVSRMLLTECDIKTLDNGAFLNDNIIQFCLFTLSEKYYCRKVYMFNTFLVKNLRQGISCDNWSKTANPAEYEFIFVPIHNRGNHWNGAILWHDALATAGSDRRTFSLAFVDSLHRFADNRDSRLLQDNFSRLHIDVIVKAPPKDLPKQDNDCDCGVFVLAFFEHFLQDLIQFKRAVEEETSLDCVVYADILRSVIRERAEAAKRAKDAEESKKLDSASPADGWEERGVSAPPSQRLLTISSEEATVQFGTQF